MRWQSIALLIGSFVTFGCGSDTPTRGASATETNRVAGIATPDDDNA